MAEEIKFILSDQTGAAGTQPPAKPPVIAQPSPTAVPAAAPRGDGAGGMPAPMPRKPGVIGGRARDSADDTVMSRIDGNVVKFPNSAAYLDFLKQRKEDREKNKKGGGLAERIGQKISGTLQSAAGKAAQSGATGVAGAAAGGIVGQAAGIAAKAGPAGVAIGALVVAAVALKKSFDVLSSTTDQMADDLIPYSPDLAAQKAQEEVKGIQFKIQRAQEFGPMLAEIEESRREFNRAWTELQDTLIAPMMPMLVDVIDTMTTISKNAKDMLEILVAKFGPVLYLMGIDINRMRKRQESDVEFDIFDFIRKEAPWEWPSEEAMNNAMTGVPLSEGGRTIGEKIRQGWKSDALVKAEKEKAEFWNSMF